MPTNCGKMFKIIINMEDPTKRRFFIRPDFIVKEKAHLRKLVSDLHSEVSALKSQLKEQEEVQKAASSRQETGIETSRTLRTALEESVSQLQEQRRLNASLEEEKEVLRENLRKEEASHERAAQEKSGLKQKCHEGQATNSQLLQQVEALEKTRNEQKKENEALVKEKRQLEEMLSEALKKCEGKGEAEGIEEKAKTKKWWKKIGKKLQAVAAVGRNDSSLFVRNCCDDFNNGKDFSVVLRLPGRPTVGDVRRAIAHDMRRPPARMELRRRVAKTKSGEEVFDIGRDSPVFADVSGGEKDGSEVEKNEDKTLHDDDQPFPVVAGHKSVIFVHPR